MIFCHNFFVFLHGQQNLIYNVAFECLQFEIHNHELGPKWIRSIFSKIHIITIFLNCQRYLWVTPISKWCSSYINRKGKNGENCGAHLDMPCIMLKRSMHFSCVLWETLPWWRRWRLLSHSAEAGLAGKLVKLLRPIWVPCYAIMIMMKGLTRIVRGLVG